jgi:type II secretion system protein H
MKTKGFIANKMRRGFTLIEIMVVVAIMGLMAAMGVPAILKAVQKEGMRKALSDLTDVCASARAKAIFSNQKVAVVFHPADRTFAVQGGGAAGSAVLVSSSTLPNGVELAMLDVNQQDCLQLAWANVWFFPNGTSDEMTVVLHDRGEWHKISLEFSTGIASVGDVDR